MFLDYKREVASGLLCAFMLLFLLQKQSKMNELKEIYHRAVEAGLNASGLTRGQLANCRAEKCVIARVVLVDILVKLGFTESDIVELSGMSQQRVNSLKNSARHRLQGLAARIMREEVEVLISLTAENNQ